MRTCINMDGLPGVITLALLGGLAAFATWMLFNRLLRPRIMRTLDRWSRELRNLPRLCAYVVWADNRQPKASVSTLATVRALIDGAR